MNTFYINVVWLLSILGALFIGGYLKSYFSKKGENLATKEDIEKLTRVQEEIKTELSERTWSKQRHWDLKRDTALEVMRVFGELQQLLNTLFQELKPGDDPEITAIGVAQGVAAAMSAAEKLVEERKKLLREYLLTMRKFWQAQGTVGMVFSADISKLMTDIQDALAHLISLLGQRDPPFTEAEKTSRMTNLGLKKTLLTEAIRKELQI